MKTVIHAVLSIALIAITCTSCKKDDDVAVNQNCLITGYNVGSTSYVATHYSDGKIASITFGSDVSTFLYNGNTIIKTNRINAVFNSKAIITVGSNGLATNVRTEFNESGSMFANDAYQYNGTEVSKHTRTASVGGLGSITNYTYSGGNLISSNRNGVITTYEYNSNQVSQSGDYFGLQYVFNGYEVFRSKNTVRSINSGGNITNYDYIIDADGKIATLKEVSSSRILDYNYQYTCK